MNTSIKSAETIIKSIEKLPRESLLELAQFIDYLQYKNQQQTLTNKQPITLEESEQLTEELLKEIGNHSPNLSDYAVSRAGIYDGHP